MGKWKVAQSLNGNDSVAEKNGPHKLEDGRGGKHGRPSNQKASSQLFIFRPSTERTSSAFQFHIHHALSTLCVCSRGAQNPLADRRGGRRRSLESKEGRGRLVHQTLIQSFLPLIHYPCSVSSSSSFNARGEMRQ